MRLDNLLISIIELSFEGLPWFLAFLQLTNDSPIGSVHPQDVPPFFLQIASYIPHCPCRMFPAKQDNLVAEIGNYSNQ